MPKLKGLPAPLIRLCVLGVLVALPLGARADFQNLSQLAFAGHWQQVLYRAAPVIATNPVRGNLLAARAALELGRFNEAIAFAEAARVISPKSQSAHLLIGVAHLRSGKSRQAGYFVRRAIDLSQTDAERAQARSILRDIRAGRDWQLSGSLGLAPSTNINRATSAALVNGIFGVGQLSGVVVQSGVGLQAQSSARRVWSQQNGGTVAFSFGGLANGYEDRALTSGYLWAGFDFTKPQSASKFTFGSIALSHQVQGNRHHADTLRLAYGLGWASQSGGLNKVTFSLERQHRIGISSFNSSSVGLGYQRSQTKANGVQLGWGVDFSYRTSFAPEIGNLTLSSFVSAEKQYKSGWRLGANAALNYGAWHDREALFLQARRDRGAQVSLSAAYLNKSFFGMSPKISVTAQVNQSNIAIYSFDSVDVFLGLTNSF